MSSLNINNFNVKTSSLTGNAINIALGNASGTSDTAGTTLNDQQIATYFSTLNGEAKAGSPASLGIQDASNIIGNSTTTVSNLIEATADSINFERFSAYDKSQGGNGSVTVADLQHFQSVDPSDTPRITAMINYLNSQGSGASIGSAAEYYQDLTQPPSNAGFTAFGNGNQVGLNTSATTPPASNTSTTTTASSSTSLSVSTSSSSSSTSLSMSTSSSSSSTSLSPSTNSNSSTLPSPAAFAVTIPNPDNLWSGVATFFQGTNLDQETNSNGYTFNFDAAKANDKSFYLWGDFNSTINNSGNGNILTDNSLAGSFNDSGNGGYDGLTTSLGQMTANGSYNKDVFNSTNSGVFTMTDTSNNNTVDTTLGGKATQTLSGNTNTINSTVSDNSVTTLDAPATNDNITLTTSASLIAGDSPTIDLTNAGSGNNITISGTSSGGTVELSAGATETTSANGDTVYTETSGPTPGTTLTVQAGANINVSIAGTCS